MRILLLLCFLVSPIHLLAKERMNIIFILADDLGYGDLGCYGQKQIKTPHLDTFAKQGLRLTQGYAGSTVCAPSRCTVMTGLHTGHCKIRGNADQSLNNKDLTLATVLHRAGYATACVGKWGLGDPGTPGVPSKHGFDYFYGYLNQKHAHNYYPDHLWTSGKGEEPRKVPFDNVVVNGVSTNKATYSVDSITANAVKFIEDNKDKPFFLYYTPTLPHANNEARNKGMEIPSPGIYGDKDWPEAQKNHAAMISRLDSDVGLMLKKLDDLKLSDNTVVFFSSDNGPHKEGGADPAFFNSSGPLQGYKRALTEGGIRVPTMVRGPGIPSGTSDVIFTFWDLFPTACSIAGIDCPKNLDGVTVWQDLQTNKATQNDRALYWEFHERGSKQAIRQGKWKAIKAVNQPLQLFDLSTDLHEDNDLSKQQPELVARFTKMMQEMRTDVPEWQLKATPPAKKKNPAKK